MEGRCAELLPKETSSKTDAAAAEGGSGLLALGCHSSVDFLKDYQELNLIRVSKQLEFRKFCCQVESFSGVRTCLLTVVFVFTGSHH